MRPLGGGSRDAQRLSLVAGAATGAAGSSEAPPSTTGGPQDCAADEAGESDAAEGEAEAAELCEPGQSAAPALARATTGTRSTS